MITTTVRAVLKREVEGYKRNRLPTGHTLYLVRDEAVVFYIGKSNDPLYRFQQHIGATPRTAFPSVLGQLILDNQPGSLEWVVELSTVVDCGEILASYLPSFYAGRYQEIVRSAQDEIAYLYDKNAVQYSEEALIDHYHPCLNTLCNPLASPLPSRYTHARPGQSSSLKLAL